MHNDKLSICIPTYNRASYLKETLLAIISQAQNYDIPICVSDNSSSDNTIEILNEMKSIYKYFSFQINAENYGIDRNIIKAVEMADTQYVWLFGDDDLIEDNSIEEILNKIELDYDLLIVNSSTNNVDFTKKIEERHFKVYEDRIYGEHDYEDLLTDTASYTTFLGSLIVKRGLWSSISYHNYLDSDFVHSGIIYSYVIGKRAYVISKPLIKIRLQNASWASRQFDVWMINWPKLIWGLPKEYSDETKMSVVSKKPYNSWKSILFYRAINNYNVNHYNKLIKYNQDVSIFNKLMHKFIILLRPKHVRLLLLLRFKVIKLLNKEKTYNYELTRLLSGD